MRLKALKRKPHPDTLTRRANLRDQGSPTADALGWTLSNGRGAWQGG